MTPVGNGYLRRSGEGITIKRTATGQVDQLGDWQLATNDDAAAVETAGVFDGFADRMKSGECLTARLDLDNTPILKHYIVNVVAGAVTLIPAL